jgi:HAMP domain-containing protein
LIYSGSSVAQTTGLLGAAATLSTAAIAFLAGYGVEGVFNALDALITQVFRVSSTDKPPQPAA